MENTSIRFPSYSAKTKRDGQTDGRTDGGALQYLPSPGLRRCGRYKFGGGGGGDFGVFVIHLFL